MVRNLTVRVFRSSSVFSDATNVNCIIYQIIVPKTGSLLLQWHSVPLHCSSQCHFVADLEVVHALLHALNQSTVLRRHVLMRHRHSPLDIAVGSCTTPRVCGGLWSRLLLRLLIEFGQSYYMMSWLSTLGGAFSALGEADIPSAVMAGRIACHQYRLARCMRHDALAVRCLLFAAISLIQRRRGRLAGRLLRAVWRHLVTTRRDKLLANMYCAIVAKLRYARRQRAVQMTEEAEAEAAVMVVR